MLFDREYKNDPNDSSEGMDEQGSLRIVTNDTLSFNTEITEESADDFIQAVYLMNNALQRIALDYPSYKPRINILLSTQGGSVYDVIRMVDSVICSTIPVNMYASGIVASSGLFLLLNGTNRYSFPHTSFLYHEVTGGFTGNKSKLRDYYQHTENLVGRIDSMVLEKTNITKEQLENMAKQEYWFDAKDALELGFVTEIVSKIKI